jgi:exopolyphosphatase/guanosine-5'-triphosphate,3'-diphosphate pyrophosphatase
VQGYPDEGGATEAPDGMASGEFPAGLSPQHSTIAHLSSPTAHSNGAGGGNVAAAQLARDARPEGVYGALDLGTNNCRLLLARPSRRGFRVVDAFSRIIRLGEGVSQTGRLSEPAMARTIDALKVCAAKLGRAKVRR